jgi:hypothetical protein
LVFISKLRLYCLEKKTNPGKARKSPAKKKEEVVTPAVARAVRPGRCWLRARFAALRCQHYASYLSD